jgi:hypothetical protein
LDSLQWHISNNCVAISLTEFTVGNIPQMHKKVAMPYYKMQ